jgi:hypothetical protein
MGFFKPLIDFFTLGSPRPLLRLIAYYSVLALAVLTLAQFGALTSRFVPGGRIDAIGQASQVLQDGLSAAPVAAVTPAITSPLEFVVSTTILFLAVVALMLPVTWVYMSDHKVRVHDQGMVETLIVLPIVVAGTVLVVRNSLALAFSLAGVVAAVRFKTSLSDTRDVVFIFLAIAVGFAAGVQVLTVAAVLSILFNFLLLVSWRYDFGRNVLQPTAAGHWKDPLEDLSKSDSNGKEVPDRDLVLALTPTKVKILSRKFNRVRALLGDDGKKPRYNAIVSITTNELAQAQHEVEPVLEELTKRWKLDEVVTNDGKASELFYLVRARKSTTRDALLTAIRAGGNGSIVGADMEIGDAVVVESGEIHDAKKRDEQRE